MEITILTDDKDSWFIEYGERLAFELQKYNHNTSYVFDKKNIKQGDICFLLSCSRLVESRYLNLSTNNIVVHASDLPEGKGFSPLQWQILEGNNSIKLTLFEAVAAVDAGPYFFKREVQYDGTELYKELRQKLGDKIVEMCIEFVVNYNSLKPLEQSGTETFYLRRTQKDDELDINKSIKDQFNHFRIADNDNYPLYFMHNGQKYFLKIEKSEN